MNYFNNIYTSSSPAPWLHTINLRWSKLNQSDNDDISRIPSVEEIFDILKSMKPMKCPGSDWYPTGFFRNAWSTTGNDVVQTIQNFFLNKELPKGLNHTYICLIPKKPCCETLVDYRPINLTNAIYKLIVKIIASHLKTKLQSFISHSKELFCKVNKFVTILSSIERCFIILKDAEEPRNFLL